MTEPSPSLDEIAPKIEDIEEVEAAIDVKPDVFAPDAVFIADIWPALAPVKVEPQVAFDPRQASDFDSDDTFNARIAGFRLATASLLAQSVISVDVPPNTLGPAKTPQSLRRPKGSKNRRCDPVVDHDATPEVGTPRKFARAHDNMALW